MDTKTEKAKADRPDAKEKPEAAPAGYVYVARTEPTVEVDGEMRPAGYVHVPGQEERRLVDEKSVPELEVLGYRVVG